MGNFGTGLGRGLQTWAGMETTRKETDAQRRLQQQMLQEQVADRQLRATESQQTKLQLEEQGNVASMLRQLVKQQASKDVAGIGAESREEVANIAAKSGIAKIVQKGATDTEQRIIEEETLPMGHKWTSALGNTGTLPFSMSKDQALKYMDDFDTRRSGSGAKRKHKYESAYPGLVTQVLPSTFEETFKDGKSSYKEKTGERILGLFTGLPENVTASARSEFFNLLDEYENANGSLPAYDEAAKMYADQTRYAISTQNLAQDLPPGYHYDGVNFRKEGFGIDRKLDLNEMLDVMWKNNVKGMDFISWEKIKEFAEKYNMDEDTFMKKYGDRPIPQVGTARMKQRMTSTAQDTVPNMSQSVTGGAPMTMAQEIEAAMKAIDAAKAGVN